MLSLPAQCSIPTFLIELDASARVAFFGELHLELARPTLTIFTAMIMRIRYAIANTWTTYSGAR